MRSFEILLVLSAVVLICSAESVEDRSEVSSNAKELLAVDTQTGHDNESRRKARQYLSYYPYGGYGGFGGYRYGGYGGYGGYYGGGYGGYRRYPFYGGYGGFGGYYPHYGYSYYG